MTTNTIDSSIKNRPHLRDTFFPNSKQLKTTIQSIKTLT